jgi:hypothetical protein
MLPSIFTDGVQEEEEPLNRREQASRDRQEARAAADVLYTLEHI